MLILLGHILRRVLQQWLLFLAISGIRGSLYPFLYFPLFPFLLYLLFAYCHRFLYFGFSVDLSFPLLSSWYLMLSKTSKSSNKNCPDPGISLFSPFPFYISFFSILVELSPLLQKHQRSFGTSVILDGVIHFCTTSGMLQ